MILLNISGCWKCRKMFKWSLDIIPTKQKRTLRVYMGEQHKNSGIWIDKPQVFRTCWRNSGVTITKRKNFIMKTSSACSLTRRAMGYAFWFVSLYLFMFFTSFMINMYPFLSELGNER